MSLSYKISPSDYTRDMEQFRVFVGTITSVDYERMVFSVEDIRTRFIYREVSAFPCSHSDYESTSIQMPREGASCLCVPIHYMGGHAQIAILAWMTAHTKQALDSISDKPFELIEGLNRRKRGNYRKAYPGHSTTSTAAGYTERIDSGWDRATQGLDRDSVDANRRTWSKNSSRFINYSDAGLSFEGPVVRTGAASISKPTVLPDGSREYTLFLQPNTGLADRYTSNQKDVVAYSEQTTRIQEFALDYPLPQEVLESPLIDSILGTTASPWAQTTLSTQGVFQKDNQTFFADQDFDHPTTSGVPTVGPTLGDGPTPQRKGFILEHSVGTLVGYNQFDTGTYGMVLKPVLSPLNRGGRFGADFESGYNAVVDSTFHAQARLAASCYSMRFPNEYNTTRLDVSKEGMVTFEIGSTMPNENLGYSPKESYEHPHGAGRSIEGHLVGSLKLVVGKNRDEEDSIDLQAIGQTVLRLGCDDTTLPDSGRSVQTQIRGSGDKVQPRTLQYWSAANRKLKALADPGSLANKVAGESVSIRMALDGALVARLGARTPTAMRRHFINGYSDGQGKTFSSSALNSHSPGRPAYAAGDATFRFHDLSMAGAPQVGMPPYSQWLGNPVPGGMDAHGLSFDLHAVRDVLLRIGKNPASGQSLLLDFDGGMVIAAGADNQGRSLTGALDGGVELTIGKSTAKRGLRLEINGDVDLMVKGNMNHHVTGDYILECTNFRQITKLDHVVTAQTINHTALSTALTQAPQVLNNSGSTPNQSGGYA